RSPSGSMIAVNRPEMFSVSRSSSYQSAAAEAAAMPHLSNNAGIVSNNAGMMFLGSNCHIGSSSAVADSEMVSSAVFSGRGLLARLVGDVVVIAYLRTLPQRGTDRGLFGLPL